MRCAREFIALLGFWPEAMMTPLRPGESPGEPAAATKRFTFVDARDGTVMGRTEVRPARETRQSRRYG